MHGEEFDLWWEMWGQAVEAVLGHSSRWERAALSHQKTGLLPVSSLLPAFLLLFTFLVITEVMQFWSSNRDLSLFLVLHFEADAPCKPYTLMTLISLLLLMLLESSHFNFAFLCCSWSINIHISLCGCRKDWAVVPLGEYNSMGTQSKYFFISCSPWSYFSDFMLACGRSWEAAGAAGCGSSFCTREPALVSLFSYWMRRCCWMCTAESG